jgi:uracil-DNA glycosylase family 4
VADDEPDTPWTAQPFVPATASVSRLADAVRGHPFVGPAGRVLWECVADAGIEHDDVYVTNAVEHFKHEMRSLT